MSIEEILEALKPYNGRFAREAVRAAIDQREAITPHLLAGLDEVASNPEAYWKRKDYMFHYYAMYLLAQFREKKAFPIIMKLASAPENMVSGLMGDLITHGLPSILGSTYNGDLESIVQLVLNRDRWSYVRSGVIDTFVMLYYENLISREQLMSIFERLFRELGSEDEGNIWDSLTVAVGFAQASDFLPQVREAYRRRLVDDSEVGLQSIEFNCNDDPAYVVSWFKEDNHLVTDTVSEMEWWEAFRPETNPLLRSPGLIGSRDGNMYSDHLEIPELNLSQPKIGRNDPCPCGSGKKYKKCCLLKRN